MQGMNPATTPLLRITARLQDRRYSLTKKRSAVRARQRPLPESLAAFGLLPFSVRVRSLFFGLVAVWAWVRRSSRKFHGWVVETFV